MTAQKLIRTDKTSVVNPKNGQVIGEQELHSKNKSIKSVGTNYSFKREIIWKLVFFYGTLHLLGLYGLYRMCFSCLHLTMLYSILVGVASQVGINMGAHRLYAHKSFKAKLPLRVALVMLDTIAGMYTVYYWVRDHRLHHKYSDTDADPHNSSRGFFFSHFGWLVSKKHPAVAEYGKTIDLSDLKSDKVIMFQIKYYLPIYLVLNSIIIAVPVWLWSETLTNSLFVSYFFRYILFLNITCCVNSWAHFYGSKPYDKYIRSIESNLLSFLVVGEGWHNYHHTFPWDYQAAEFGLHYSLTTCLIDLSSRFGLAYDLKSASKQMVQKRIMRTGYGSQKVNGFNTEIEEHSKSKDKVQTIECSEYTSIINNMN